MRVLVTGATGFVGSHLVELLLGREVHVRATCRRSSKKVWLEGKPVEWIESDLREGKGLDEACRGVDVVYHVAGVINAPREEDYRAGNAVATRHVAAAAVRAKVKRFVQVSSLAAAGPSDDGSPLTEDEGCRPVSIYGRTKLEGEEEARKRAAEMEVVVIRPPVVYGPRDTGLVEMFQLLQAGVKPKIGAEKFISIIHVSDLVRGIAAAGEHPEAAGETFYLSHARFHSQGEVMDLILRALDRRALSVPVPDRVVRFLGGIAEDTARWFGLHSMFHRDKALEMTQRAWVCSPAKAARVLGWSAAIDLERGLSETLRWYREHEVV